MEDYPNPKYVPRIQYLLGQFAQELGQWDEALTAYEEIVNHYPDHLLAPDAQYKLAQCYEERGDFDAALEAYVTLAATYPKSPLISSVMIRISDHFYKAEEYTIAAQVGEKFIEKFEGHQLAPKMAFRVGQCFYKAKKFTEAASVMLAASKAASDPEQSKELRLKGGFYGSFGKNFNTGMAPSTSAKDAWTALTAARTYDNSLGGDYIAEINSHMGEIAPKAAVAFMAGKNFVKAKEAVAVAERSGNSNSTTAGVRSSLEQKAGDLYKEADSLKSSDPAAATQKFREVQGMVDSKSPWHQKAGKALIAIKSS